ncbi:MAG: helix-turn-helix transcriptional regulator [Clostridia bacterium]|nr:helix-turn-helix transcriptional regulator [Clostridia bacterium]
MFDVEHFLKEMGHRMYLQRKQLGLTQERVAELADISPQLLSNAENGIQVIGSDKLYRISQALEVSADYLLSGNYSEKDAQILQDKLQNANDQKRKAIDKIADIIIDLDT